jgi:hypothetical protein
MKQFLLFLVFISSTNLFAARQITVTQLPEPNIPLTEAETNVVFSRGVEEINVESKYSSTGFKLYIR